MYGLACPATSIVTMATAGGLRGSRGGAAKLGPSARRVRLGKRVNAALVSRGMWEGGGRCRKAALMSTCRSRRRAGSCRLRTPSQSTRLSNPPACRRITLWCTPAQLSCDPIGSHSLIRPLESLHLQPRTLPSGDQVARLMLIHSLADAAADAVLLGQPLTAPDRASLLYLWPNLLRLTAAAPPGVAATASPFAAAANVVLVERHDCFAAAPVALTLPQLHAHDSQQYCSCATACRFDLLAAPADAEAAAELQVCSGDSCLAVVWFAQPAPGFHRGSGACPACLPVSPCYCC